MKSWFKKVCCVSIALLFSVGIFTGCKDTFKGGEGSYKTTFDIYMGITGPTTAIENTPIGKEILKRTNVDLSIEYGVGDVDSRLTMMMFSEDYPDLILPNSQDNQTRLIAKKALVDMSKYENTDAYKAVYAAYDCGEYNLLDMIKQSRGGVYYLPYLMTGAGGDNTIEQTFYIQNAVLKEFDYPEVKTLEQYWKVISDYYAKYPTINGLGTIGYTMQNETGNSWRFDSITNPVPAIYGYQNDGGWFVDMQSDGKYKVVSQSGSNQEYEYFKKINGYYKENLIDKEFYTHNTDQWFAKMGSGRVLAYFGWGYEITEINGMLSSAGMTDRTFVPVRLLVDGVTKDRYNGHGPHDISRGMGISVNCKDPLRAIQFFADMLDEDVYKIRKWGIEGEDYAKNADGSVIMDQATYNKYVNSQNAERRGFSGATFLGFPERPWANFTFSDGMKPMPSNNTDYQSYELTALEKEYLGKYGYKSYADMFDVFDMPYGYAYTAANGFDAASDSKKVLTALEEIRHTNITAIITASNFETAWAKYKSDIEKIQYGGLAKVEQAMTAEINKRVEEGRFA